MSMEITPFVPSHIWEGEWASTATQRTMFRKMNANFLEALQKHHGKKAVAPKAKKAAQPVEVVPAKPAEPLSVGLLDDIDEAEMAQVRAILRRDSVRRVVEAISERTGIKPTRIVSTSRNKEVVAARNWAFAELQEAGFSLTQMGRMFQKDHTTVLHGIRMHRERTGVPA